MAVVSVVVEIVRCLPVLLKNFFKILPCRAVKCYKSCLYTQFENQQQQHNDKLNYYG
ncbi:hypothetical protein DOY81_012677 [Sarcophaga bullata]|nr:hypothetical protein DOY81_012677 [Sarcophaga bullata]